MPMLRTLALAAGMIAALAAGCQRAPADSKGEDERERLQAQLEEARKDANKYFEERQAFRQKASELEAALETARQAKSTVEKQRDDFRAQHRLALERLAAPYVHTVIFHLKNDAPVDDMVKDFHQALSAISDVRAYWVGKPAKESAPDAEKGFHLGLHVHFDSFEALERYRADPKHKALGEKYEKHVEKRLVFDTMAENASQ